VIAPVGYHRIVFRQRLRPQLVTTGHRYSIAGLILLLALVGAVQLAASFVLGQWAALLAAALAGLFVLLWFIIPLIHRVQHQHRPTPPDPDRQSGIEPLAQLRSPADGVHNSAGPESDAAMSLQVIRSCGATRTTTRRRYRQQ
jgi:Family of unknown function (DUF6328)